MGSRKAVFLDRDGVLVHDVGPLTRASDIAVLAEAPSALLSLKRAGYLLLVVSNQTVVARGLLDEAGVLELEREVERRIVSQGGPRLDGFYFCPHHPSATRPELRRECDCRKPAPGLLLRAAAEHDVALDHSFMIGDRVSDIVAGYRAGCTTIQLLSGAHAAPAIEVSGGFEARTPDYCAATLADAATLALAHDVTRSLPLAAGGRP